MAKKSHVGMRLDEAPHQSYAMVSAHPHQKGEWKFMEKIFGWVWHEFLVPVKDLRARNVDLRKIWPLP
jgi:hypothetical protein